MLAIDLTIIAAFGGGILAFFTPCVLPLLPGMLAGSVGDKLRPLLIVLGMALFLMFLGALSGVLGIFLINNDILRIIAGVLLIAIGIYWLWNLQLVKNPINRLLEWFSRHHLDNRIAGPLMIGCIISLAGLSCTGPILGPVFALIATSADPAYGAFLLFWFALGIGLPMMVFAYILKVSTTRLKSIGRWEGLIRRVAGAILVVMGVVFILGLDYILVAALL